MKWKPTRNQLLAAGAAYGAFSMANYVQNETDQNDWYTRAFYAATADHVQDIAGWWNKKFELVPEDAVQGIGSAVTNFALEVPEEIQAAPSPRSPIEF